MRGQTVTSEPVIRSLATVQACRAYIGGIDDADTASSSVLTDLIAASSQRVRVELGYRPWLTRYLYGTQLIRAEDVMTLPAKINVHVYHMIGPDGRDLTDLTPGVVTGEDGLVHTKNGFPPGDYTVEYEAGWPAGTSVVNIPEDLLLAVIQMVAQEWFQRGRSPDLSAESLDGIASINYDPRQVPMNVREILDTYKLYGV